MLIETRLQNHRKRVRPEDLKSSKLESTPACWCIATKHNKRRPGGSEACVSKVFEDHVAQPVELRKPIATTGPPARRDNADLAHGRPT